MTQRAPAMFISHGSPMFAVEPGQAGALLTGFGEQLSDVTAVLVISPHWMTRGLELMSAAQPETLHDFGGFPRELYQLQFDAPGSSEIAAQVKEVLEGQRIGVDLNPRRGRDHGAWVPMLHLLPDTDVPVFQLSLDMTMDAEALIKLGKALLPLREQGIAVIASGGLTHNLYEICAPGSPPAEYVQRFQAWVREQVSNRNLPALALPQHYNADFQRAHPTAEHYLPLLIALGASDAKDQLSVLEGGILHGVLSMESYGWT